MKSRWLVLICLLVCGVVFGSVQAQNTCQDAAGGPIPCTPTPEPSSISVDSDGDGWPDVDDRCPAESGLGTFGRGDCPDPDGDFITNDGDLCPNDPGPAETGGCPPATSTPVAPEPTAVPTAGPARENPLRPPMDGECAMTTRGLERVNVRSAPEADGPIVGTLEPTVVYPVDAVVIRHGILWIRKQGADPEYVRVDTVFIGGGCAFGNIEVEENAGYVDLTPLNDLSAGTLPLEQCVRLINGADLCDVVLSEVNPDGSDAGKSKFCKGLKGWLICTAIEIVAENLCTFIDCPGPNQGGYDDPGDGAEPGDGDAGTGDAGQDGVGDGQVYCEDVIGDLLAAVAESEAAGTPAISSVFSLGTGVEPVAMAMLRPAINNRGALDVTPDCLLDIEVIQPNEASSGVAPYDRIMIEVLSWPPPGEMPLSLFAFGSDYHTLMDRALMYLNGDVCIPAAHAGFQACPPTDPTVPGRLVTSTASDQRLLNLLAIPPGGVPMPSPQELALPDYPGDPSDPTAYHCTLFAPLNEWNCGCAGADDCVAMLTNVCVGADWIQCSGTDYCHCSFPAGGSDDE